MSEDLRSILQSLADNDMMLDAVKKVILHQFKDDKMDTNMTNEILGQKARARLEGIQRVEAGFQTIKKFQSLKEHKQAVNPAR